MNKNGNDLNDLHAIELNRDSTISICISSTVPNADAKLHAKNTETVGSNIVETSMNNLQQRAKADSNQLRYVAQHLRENAFQLN